MTPLRGPVRLARTDDPLFEQAIAGSQSTVPAFDGAANVVEANA